MIGMDHFSVRATGWKAAQQIDYAASLKLDTCFISELSVFESFEDAYLQGLKDQADKAGLKLVFGVLRDPIVEEPANWSRRYKANLEKLASGDVIKVSEVVRDLWRREQDRGLSAGEKRMLAKARQILISELALAEKTDEERASNRLDEVLAS
jgi:CarD family transcriptional regulator